MRRLNTTPTANNNGLAGMARRTECLAQQLPSLSISQATFMSPDTLTIQVCIQTTAQLSTTQPVNSNGWRVTTGRPGMHLIMLLALLSMAQAMFLSRDPANAPRSTVIMTTPRSSMTRRGNSNGWPATTDLGVGTIKPRELPLTARTTST